MDTRLGGAGYHDVRVAKCDESGCISNRMSARGASCGHRVGRAFEAVAHRNMSRGEIDQKLRDEIRRHFLRALREH